MKFAVIKFRTPVYTFIIIDLINSNYRKIQFILLEELFFEPEYVSSDTADALFVFSDIWSEQGIYS